jgi:2-oxo-4-hydroxy-4-carboxy-5-ureidoimidazoline decarboxylase
MQLDSFNKMEKEEVTSMLSKCCGSSKWVSEMMKFFPFHSQNDLLQKAEEAWHTQCNEKDWLEAFTHHPKIGDIKSLEEKFASTKAWAGSEQAGVQKASKPIIEALAKGNEEYEKKFSFIFIVCATGKSSEEMLELLKERLTNNYKKELRIAMEEQNKITKLRLQKLLS